LFLRGGLTAREASQTMLVGQNPPRIENTKGVRTGARQERRRAEGAAERPFLEGRGGLLRRGAQPPGRVPPAGQEVPCGKERRGMRAAVYVRVSTEDQARHGFSLAEQEEACRRRAAELGAAEVLVFRDEGASGASLDRPGLSALREAARAGRVDALICRDPDRLSRRLAHQILLTEEFEKAGVRLEFLDFTWQDTPEGRLFYSIRGAIAEYEREKIRERTMRGKIQKARQGGVPHKFQTYGYDYDPATEKITVNEAEASVVREIFRLFLEEDAGSSKIGRILNDAGIPAPRARWWTQVAVKRILANETYTGVWWYGKLDCRGGRVPGRKFPERPREEWLPVNVPAIIPRETWERAQEKLAEARRLWAGRPKERYLLSGLVACRDCGGRMHGSKFNVWGRRERHYTCRINSAGRRSGCPGHRRVRADKLEKAVWEIVVECLRDPEALAREMMDLQEGGGAEEELRRVEAALKAVEKGRESVLDALAAGLFELDARTKARLADLKRRKERLEARRRELEALLRGAGSAAARLEELRALAREALGRLDELSFEEKRTLIRSVVKEVAVEGRGESMRVTVRLQVPAPELAIIPAGIRD